MKSSIRLEISKGSVRRFNNTDKRIKKGVLKGVKKGMALFKTKAKTFGGANQLKIRTGALRDSIDYTIKDTNNVITGTLGSDKLYAAIHEYGGTISARRAKYLIFKTNSGWRRVSSVTIPPRPFLKPAVEKNTGEFSKIINHEVLKSFRSSNPFGR